MTHSQLLELQPGEVDLWFALPDSPQVQELNKRYEKLLSKHEREQYYQLKLLEHRQEYLVSRALLRATLSRYLPQPPEQWDFARNRFGKPELPAEVNSLGLQFNVAHTCGLVACAVTVGCAVGVDVEYHANSKALLEVADHYFSNQEIADLKAQPESVQDQYFFRYWTLKESYIKAKGKGLSIPLESFSFRFEGQQVIFVPPEEEGEQQQWSFSLLKPAEHYTAALAVKGALSSLRLFEAVPLGDSRALRDVSELFDLGYEGQHRRGVC